MRMPFCVRRISGNSKACSLVTAFEMTAISGSTPAVSANAPYHASSQRKSWNGVALPGSFQCAAACFQSWTNSTRKPGARDFSRVSVSPASAVSTVIAIASRRLRQVDDLAGIFGVEPEVDRTARAALAFHPLAVAQQFLHHRLGEIGRTA